MAGLSLKPVYVYTAYPTFGTVQRRRPGRAALCCDVRSSFVIPVFGVLVLRTSALYGFIN